MSSLDDLRGFKLLAESLSTEALRLIRYSYLLDLREPAVDVRIWADGRIRAIERVLRERGEPIETPVDVPGR